VAISAKSDRKSTPLFYLVLRIQNPAPFIFSAHEDWEQMSLGDRYTNNLIEVEGLTKVFATPQGEVQAVAGVSFSIAEGEVVGLLGANGAGKTTLMRILSTLLAPTSGHARIAGLDVVQHPLEVRKQIGLLSGSTGLYNRLTPRQVLLYFAGLYGLNRKEQKSRVEELVAEWGITPFADQLCDRLSTGQLQRTSIARALVGRPKVLLFDEPTSGLDVLTSQTMMEFIESCRDKGITVLYSTHIMSEAERLCQRVILLHKGKEVWHGLYNDLLAETGETRLEAAFLKKVGYQQGEDE
jgi:sodium transport system ATP-binding protein